MALGLGCGVPVLVLTPMQCLAQDSMLVCAVAMEMWSLGWWVASGQGLSACLCFPEPTRT